MAFSHRRRWSISTPTCGPIRYRFRRQGRCGRSCAKPMSPAIPRRACPRMQSLWGGGTPDYGRQVLTAYAAARLPVDKDLADNAGADHRLDARRGLDRNAMRWAGVSSEGSRAWALAGAGPAGASGRGAEQRASILPRRRQERRAAQVAIPARGARRPRAAGRGRRAQLCGPVGRRSRPARRSGARRSTRPASTAIPPWRHCSPVSACRAADGTR